MWYEVAIISNDETKMSWRESARTGIQIWLFYYSKCLQQILVFEYSLKQKKINNIFILIHTYMYLKEVIFFFLEKNKFPATEMHVCCLKSQ